MSRASEASLKITNIFSVNNCPFLNNKSTERAKKAMIAVSLLRALLRQERELLSQEHKYWYEELAFRAILVVCLIWGVCRFGKGAI
jgi:hypothetical protein